MKSFSTLAVSAVLAAAPAFVSASTLLVTIDGNDCSGVFGNPPNCVATYADPTTGEVLLKPTPLIGKFDYADDEGNQGEWTFGNFASIDGTEFVITIDEENGGSWTYTPGIGDPIITAFVIKDSNQFDLYASSGNSGSWDSDFGGPGISHITFYDGGGVLPPTSVPEPGTALLAGLALIGLAASRKRLLK